MNIAKTILIMAALALTACGKMEDLSEERSASGETLQTVSGTSQNSEAHRNEDVSEVNEMKISINGTEYTAHFYDTKAAEEFKAMLPLTLEMSELNGNEKYIYLDSGFTAASEKVGSIKKGEIMLYGSDCVVLFYESFSTPYSYTRIGCIDDPDRLEKAVGSGSVTVEFGV